MQCKKCVWTKREAEPGRTLCTYHLKQSRRHCKESRLRKNPLPDSRHIPHTTRQEKIDWLLAHQSLWEGWQRRDSPATYDPRGRAIVEAMVADGLVSKATYWKDVSLNNLIQEARRQRRMS